MNKFYAIASICLSGAMLFSVGCNNTQPEEEFDKSPYFFAMAADAAYVLPLEIKMQREEDCYRLYGETRKLLNTLDGSFNTANETSYVSLFNEADAGAKVELDKYTYDIFCLAKDIYTLTDGYYNPAVYYNVRAYGFGGGSSYPKTVEELPTDETIEKYNILSDSFSNIGLLEESGKYYAVKPQTTVDIGGMTYSMKVDLGGIGKGYAVEEVNALMGKYKMEYGYFSFGESSITLKKYFGSDGNYYTLGLNNPRRVEGAPAQVLTTELMDVSSSTSGDNVQYYEIEGVRYCHVLNPKTGKPVQTGVMSALIFGGSAAENDALTTAIMAMGREKGVEFVNERLSDRKIVMTVERDGKYEIITNIPEGEYEVVDERYTVSSRLEDGKIILEN